MLGTTRDIPGHVSLVADHLDAALAAGEDLLAMRLAAPAEQVDDEGDRGSALAAFVAMALRHEATILAHVLQARRRADAMARTPGPLRVMARLFAANTAGLLDIAAQHGDRVRQSFERGGDPVVFLATRGLIGPNQGAAPRFGTLAVSDAYLVGGTLQLGPLLDLVASFLDLLDGQFGLYADDSDALSSAEAMGVSTAAAELPKAAVAPEKAELVEAHVEAAVTPASLAEALAALKSPSEH